GRAKAGPAAGILAQVQLHASLETKEEERLAYQQRMVDAIDRLKDYEKQSVRPAESGRQTRLLGMGASPGFGIGRAHRLTKDVSFDGLPTERRHPLKRELSRLPGAVPPSVHGPARAKEPIPRHVPES